MQVEKVHISTLVFDQANVRKHDAKNLDAIKASISRWGQVEPLIVQRSTNMVIGGNGRLEVMKSLAFSHVVVNYLDIDDAQAGALAIVLNRSGELAQWDQEALGSHLEGLKADGWDIGELGFDIEDLDMLDVELPTIEDPPEEKLKCSLCGK